MSLSASTGSLAPSSHNHALVVPSSARTVVTAPPWAQDEPPSPSPSDQHDNDDLHPHFHRPSDSITSRSSFGGFSGSLSERQSHWWTFARPREAHLYGESSRQAAKKGATHKNRPTLSLSTYRPSHDDPDSSLVSPLEKGTTYPQTGAHSLTLPSEPFTTSHNRTPGWDTPWKPKNDFPMNSRNYSPLGMAGDRTDGDSRDGSNRSRKKRFRAFILTNIYVPLLFRFTNITFTTAALALAIRIRVLELNYGVMGLMGSSPTLVIIFAPLTLVHVMVAIYLEYFGRPLGLWRTSGKLAHTLLEVCFICAWSAALSLCFDNYFTSLIPCASERSIAWYDELPRPELSLPNPGRYDNDVGYTICDYQLALICLVGIGLILYCISLVINLFRIFEKVKSHAGFRPSTRL